MTEIRPIGNFRLCTLCPQPIFDFQIHKKCLRINHLNNHCFKTYPMKTKIYLLAISLFISIAGQSQFVPVPINFQPSSYGNYPEYISITDASHVWLGNRRGDSLTQVPYTYAVHTSDGGTTWQFDSIPAPGDPIMSSVYAVDAST